LLRELAEEGYEDAAAFLIEMATQQGDVFLLRDLGDEGYEDADAALSKIIREGRWT
jgi:hypothetical protein